MKIEFGSEPKGHVIFQTVSQMGTQQFSSFTLILSESEHREFKKKKKKMRGTENKKVMIITMRRHIASMHFKR